MKPKVKTYRKPKRVHVVWQDSIMWSGWRQDFDEYTVGAKNQCETRGFLIAENRNSVFVSATVSLEPGGYVRSTCDVMEIPRRAIVKLGAEH